MPAEVETAFYGGNEAAWHRLGNVIPADVVATEEALDLSGLRWGVEKYPIFTRLTVEREIDGVDTIWGEEVAIPWKNAVVRTTDGKVLGVVGQDYKPIWNVEAFAVGDDIMDSSEAKWHSAGSLQGGRKVWMLALLGDDILVGGEQTERMRRFLLIATSHDGSMALTAIVTPVRVVCWNTFSAALSGASRFWHVRHTANAEARAVEARQALGISFRYYDELAKLGEQMMLERMANVEFDRFLNKLFPIPEDEEKSPRTAANRKIVQAQIRSIYVDSENLQNVKGTKWGALQAVFQYDDWHRGVKLGKLQGEARADLEAERRFTHAVFQPVIKNQALRLLAPEYASKSALI